MTALGASERRSARLLFGPELAAGRVREGDLAHPAVRRAVRARGVPAAPVRTLQRVAQRLGRLDYERACAAPLDAARRAVLGAAAAGPPRVLVRVDEFPHYRAHDDPERFGTTAFEGFHAMLAERGIPYLVAALPTLAHAPLDPAARGGRRLRADEVATLRRIQAEGVTLGVHGYDHRTRRADPRRHSELAGLDAAALTARLDAAEAALAQHELPRPRVFVAPYNRFDARQYGALAHRYDIVCGGPESVRAIGFRRTPLWYGEAVYLPSYAPVYGRAREIAPALRRLLAGGRALWVPVVLHWGWEAEDSFAALGELAELLRTCAARWEDFLAAVHASR